MGRLYRILKRTCHVTIDLDVEQKAAPRKTAAGERR
jgi:hypothetical protein